MSYDTFLLYIIVLPEYVESTQILPKDSSMATIWLHFFLQNKNCSQEIVESSFRVRGKRRSIINKYVLLG